MTICAGMWLMMLQITSYEPTEIQNFSVPFVSTEGFF